MQLDLSSVKGFFWAIVRILYSLIPAGFFLSVSLVLCVHFRSDYPVLLQNIIDYISSGSETTRLSVFLLTSLVLTFVTNTFEFVRWNDDKNTSPEKAVSKYQLKLDDQVNAEDVGIPNLTGVKLIHEYENLNTWTFTTMAHKDVLLGIYIYINLLLILFLPFYLQSAYRLSSWALLTLLMFQVAFSFSLFLMMKRVMGRLGVSTNWGDKTISRFEEMLGLVLFPIVGLVLLFFPLLFPAWVKVGSLAILIAINLILAPAEFLMVLAAYNYHNRVRNIVDSAFVQIRFNDMIFREKHKTAQE